jgi:hypothetical protein
MKNQRGMSTLGAVLLAGTTGVLGSVDWGLVWPFFLIIGGVAALFNGWFD